MIALATKPVLNLMGHLTMTTRLAASKFTRSFEEKVRIRAESSQYILKTAESADEIETVLKLRHEVFCHELQKRRKLFSIELDEFDLKCDHLLIIDKQTDQAVGTYRLLSSLFFSRFYSESEFHLTEFLRTPGVKLELGRACIRKEFRNGAVMQLLWRGIADYMQQTDTRYLMGCSSLHTLDPVAIAASAQKLALDGVTTDLHAILPKKGFTPGEYGIDLDQRVPENAAPEIPALLLSYLKAGAKVAPLPAIDQDFHCIDFFTILDRESVNPLFHRRYFASSSSRSS